MECQQSFDKLKSMVQSTAILGHLDFSTPFKLQTNASTHKVGAVLPQ
jgi:hypothetical protein